MWFFKKKDKKEEPLGTKAAVSPAAAPIDPDKLWQDIACDISLAIDELEHIYRYRWRVSQIIRDLEAARNKRSLEQVEEVYFAVDNAIWILGLEEKNAYLPDEEAFALSEAIQWLGDARSKCFRIW